MKEGKTEGDVIKKVIMVKVTSLSVCVLHVIGIPKNNYHHYTVCNTRVIMNRNEIKSTEHLPLEHTKEFLVEHLWEFHSIVASPISTQFISVETLC